MNRAKKTQARRTSVGSTSRYSANPPHTPAIFSSLRERISFFCGRGWTNIADPQWQQKLTFSLYSLPHWGQNIISPPDMLRAVSAWQERWPPRALPGRHEKSRLPFAHVLASHASNKITSGTRRKFPLTG